MSYDYAISHSSDGAAKKTKIPKKTYIEYYEEGLKYAKRAVEESADITNNDPPDNPK